MGEQAAVQRQVELRLIGARAQIAALVNAGEPDVAESCACAAIQQMLQALTAALARLNAAMPDPLPLARVNRRNLRDRFHAVGAESQALRTVDRVARPGNGWLWDLEQQAAGSVFGPVLRPGLAGEWAVVRSPLDPGAGLEAGSADAYLTGMLEQVRLLIEQVDALVDADATRYREALRSQNPGRI